MVFSSVPLDKSNAEQKRTFSRNETNPEENAWYLLFLWGEARDQAMCRMPACPLLFKNLSKAALEETQTKLYSTGFVAA